MDLLVGTEDGLRGPDGTVDLEGHSVTALSTDRWGVWALTDGSGVWRRTAGPWVQVTEVSGPPARCLLGTEEGLFIGTAEAGLLRLEEGDLDRVKAFDEVPGRDGWYTPWGGPPDTRSLAMDAGGTLYANVHVGGIPRSTDGGESWEPTIDVDADVHQVLGHPERPGLVLAACAPGLATSEDGGDTWDITDDGLHASYSRAVAVAGDHVLVTASTGPFTEQAAIYRRPMSGGGSFERCAGGLPEWFPSNIDSLCLAAEGDTVAFGTAEGELWRSDDGGITWERAADGLPAVNCVLVSG